jgi:hypothetical protein
MLGELFREAAISHRESLSCRTTWRKPRSLAFSLPEHADLAGRVIQERRPPIQF